MLFSDIVPSLRPSFDPEGYQKTDDISALRALLHAAVFIRARYQHKLCYVSRCLRKDKRVYNHCNAIDQSSTFVLYV